MNNVNNRKLFRKSNAARNKLREAGGIMASDAELMQTVAQYNMGGPVGYKDGDVVRVPTRGRGFVMRPGTSVGPGYANKFPMVIDQPKIPGALSRTIRGVPGLSTAAASLEQRFDPFDYQAIEQRVAPYQARQNTAPGITREQFDAMGPAQQQAYVDRFNASRYITESIPAQLREGFSIVTDPMQDLYEGIASTDIGQRIRGMISPETAGVPFEETPRRRNELAAIEDQARNRPLTASQFRLSLPSSEPEVGTDRATTEEQYMMGPGAAAPEPKMPTPDLPDEDLTQQDRDNKARLAAEQAAATEAAGGTAAVPTEDETDYLDKYVPENLDEGDTLSMGMTEEERVTAAVKSKDKDFQQGELKRLMAEFTGAAPEYEGMDKGLAIAKIGFAMAAGQSPNAISNIASALEKGADDFIKDSKDRAAFKRQVQLSALQYGLGEISKERAQARTDARTFKDYVKADGTPVAVSVADLIKNGGKLPEGLMDAKVLAANIKATNEAQKALLDRVEDLRKERIIADNVLDKRVANYTEAADTVISAEAGIQLAENAIIQINTTGATTLAAGFADLANKVANATGIDLGAKFETAADLKKTLRMLFQEMIPVTLGEAQSANSISNRDVEFLADAFIAAGVLQNGSFSLVGIDEQVLTKQIQGAIAKMRRSQASAVGRMRQIEGGLARRTVAGGGMAAEELEAIQENVAPFMPTRQGQRGSFGEQGQKYGFTGNVQTRMGKTPVGTDPDGRLIFDLTTS